MEMELENEPLYVENPPSNEIVEEKEKSSNLGQRQFNPKLIVKVAKEAQSLVRDGMSKRAACKCLKEKYPMAKLSRYCKIIVLFFFLSVKFIIGQMFMFSPKINEII